KTGRIADRVESHASRAQVDRLHLQFLAVRIFQGYGQIDLGTKELLLFLTDGTELGRGFDRRPLNLILPQFAAERAAGNSKLVGGLGAMAAGLLERPID